MTVLVTIPFTNFLGTVTSNAVAVPVGAEVIQVDFDGSTMLDARLEFETMIFYAPDGVTWRKIGGAKQVAGAFDRNGNPLALYQSGAPTIPTDGANRKLKGTLIATSNPPGAVTLTSTLRISMGP